MRNTSMQKVVTFAAAVGALGGTILTLSYIFFTPGKYLLITYAAVVLGAMLALKAERFALFGHRFTASLLSFATYAGVHYIAVTWSHRGSSLGVLGHAWRLGILVGIGAVISLAVARLSSPTVEQQHEAHAT